MKSETSPVKLTAKNRIVAAASDLFYRNGIRATGIDAVIEAADVARMTLYNHFPSKEALVDAVLQDWAERVTASLSAVLGDETSSPRDRVLAIMDWQARIIQGDGYRGCPFFNAVVENPDQDSRNLAVALSCKSLVRSEIAGAIAKLGVAHTDLLTEQICLLLDGASAHAQMGSACAAVAAARSAVEQLIDAALAAG
ncbi:MAG: TetR/AcrR family transcriptional regulator [Capsulimonadaceae bacterium]|nr:TetR/AcrR family transcriptional regulator [Capsulimonadaceae bacterium]